MVIVHHLNNSRSQRILWLLEELGVEYEIKFYKRDVNTMLAPAALRKIHPLGKSPVVTDGEVVVAESGAIIEYLLDTYAEGRLRPEKGTQEYRDFVYWLHYAEGSAMPPLLLAVVFRELPKQGPMLARPLLRGVSKAVMKGYVGPSIKAHIRYLEEYLEGREFLAGEFSAADVQMSFAAECEIAQVYRPEKYPNTAAYLKRLYERPAFHRALEKGGPYSII